eukprot:m.52669 g.52669  ORF g.52669 m.52669 type:complete len:362 (-) comp7388_c0_seq4:470-1555(-)
MDWFGGNADGGFGLGGPMGGGGFGGGFGGGRGGGGQYKEYLSCMSIAMMPGRERRDADKGGKVFLPQSVLRQLTRLNIQYPMLFSLSSAKSGRKTHCGVLEFVADPGCVNVPHWMLLNLAIQEGDQVEIESVNLPTAQFAKVQPQTQDFLDISNPKAVLEKTLRNFSCLTEADMIAIEYNGKTYELVVLELRPKHPSNAVCVVECDLELDFAPPLDYVEPPKDYGHGPVTETDSAPLPTKEELEEKAVLENVFQPYQGEGKRLDGKNDKAIPSVGPVVSGPTSEAGRREAERRARAEANAARFAPGRMRFSRPSTDRPPQADAAAASPAAAAAVAAPAAQASGSSGGTDWSKLGGGRTLKD